MPSEALCVHSFPSSSDKTSGAPSLPSQLLPQNLLFFILASIPLNIFAQLFRFWWFFTQLFLLLFRRNPAFHTFLSFVSGLLLLLFNCLLPIFCGPLRAAHSYHAHSDTQLLTSDSFRWEDPFRPPLPPQLRVNVDVFWSSPVAPSPRVPQECLQSVSFVEVRWVFERVLIGKTQEELFSETEVLSRETSFHSRWYFFMSFSGNTKHLLHVSTQQYMQSIPTSDRTLESQLF